MQQQIALRSKAGGRIVGNNLMGVAMVTEGPAIGHKMEVDRVTLSQVKGCAEACPDGVKVKINHGSGFDAIVGNLSTYRIEGGVLRADLALIKSHPRFDSIIELARTMPAAFGLSVSFSGNHETVAGKVYVRCSKLYSCDLVDEPAANPNGLFAALSQPGSLADHLRMLEGEIDDHLGAGYVRHVYAEAGIEAGRNDTFTMLDKLGVLSLKLAAYHGAASLSDQSTTKEWRDAFFKIRDPRERGRFYAAHSKEILGP